MEKFDGDIMKRTTRILTLLVICLLIFGGCKRESELFSSSGDVSSNEEETVNFKYEADDDGKCIINGIVNLKANDIVIPRQLDGYEVIGIGNSAFAGNNNIRSVSFSDTIQTIGDFAFSNCAGISEITIPANVTHIGEQAFFGCDFKKITVDSKNNEYYEEGNCIIEKKTGKIILGSSVSVIPNSDDVVCIGKYSFGRCKDMHSLTIPNNIHTIEEYAFINCVSLKEAKLPDGLKTVHSYIFNGCTMLENVYIPGSVTEIDKYAFSDCPIRKIVFEGTASRWAAINKYDRWDTNVPSHTVLCNDCEIYE